MKQKFIVVCFQFLSSVGKNQILFLELIIVRNQVFCGSIVEFELFLDKFRNLLELLSGFLMRVNQALLKCQHSLASRLGKGYKIIYVTHTFTQGIWKGQHASNTQYSGQYPRQLPVCYVAIYNANSVSCSSRSEENSV